MDPETEARLAALLMEEAQRLRQRADKEGVGAYLTKPVARVRPNPQFMRATVQGVQQANRVVEVNEMWRRRSVELDGNYPKRVRRAEQALQEDHSRGRHADSEKHDIRLKHRQHSSREQEGKGARQKSGSEPVATRQRPGENENESHQEEWKDDDVERFLNSRAKRGRGAIGCRMDEPGPYLASQSTSTVAEIRLKEDWEDRVAGPTLRADACAGQAAGLWDHRKERKRRDTGVINVTDSSRLKHKRKKGGKREKKRESSKDCQKKRRKDSTG
eukprot:TRINITY_DN24169_c0_g1_i1.p1 TRINITY_DN24169_c0_g1~~TRINITY_DN24169_c0_g1_i1.p1  ORF type:complete len:273 (+),score=61.46 TRINITY_DN24169_c0_g1_i1:218-1036(+)